MARITEMGALKVVDPAKWKAQVVSAMRQAKGRIPEAATALGVGIRQLSRWLAELPEVARAAPGRPWPEKKKKKK